MAVASFALLTLMALLSHVVIKAGGINQTTGETLIVQSIANQLQQTPFSLLTNAANTSFTNYYDSYGDTNNESSGNFAFRAAVQVFSPYTNTGMGMVLTNAAQVQVTCTTHANSQTAHIYNLYVGNTGN